MLLKAPECQNDNVGDQVKFAFGAGCDPRHHKTFEKRFGVKLIEAWAMTETGAGAWITASHEPRHVGARCFGRAPDGLEHRLIDEEGRDTPPGEPGELLVRRRGADAKKYFFSGYFKDEAATQEAWKDGWFHTGDVVRVDDQGNFYFVDRRKNVIRRSGENIAAIDVESVLMRHGDVAGCVVVPVPDEIRGDEVMAMVKTSSGANDEKTAREIFDFVMKNLAYFKTPGFISFVQSIPMTASEKINRGEAKRIGRDLHERGACFEFTALKKPVKG
jgi:acyl-coenzyme A synthetase/AMP-(fatty) acid ligase